MRRRGATLVQLLVGTIVSGFIMAALLPAMKTVWKMQAFSVGMPGVQGDAKGIALKLADALRSATLCTSTDTGCTLDAAAENATTTGITVYRRNNDGTMTKAIYSLASGNFRLQKGSAAVTTITDGASVTLTFYGSATYNSSSLTPFTPTNTTLKTLAAVGIATTVARNGISGSYSTLIRLRNSPKIP